MSGRWPNTKSNTVSKPSKIIHLLVPKEFRVYCIGTRKPTQLLFTTKPSACTCSNCLTLWRRKNRPDRRVPKGQFRVSSIRNYHTRPD